LKKTKASSSSKRSKPEQFLYLTTRGRRSGLPREIEIWFTATGGKFYVISEYPDSQWVKNVRADSAVQLRVGDERFSGRARIISADTERALHQAICNLSKEKYGWGEGVVVEIDPEPSRLL
jgi:deazaflavin-dependent oxidoreductase (nitroreductase family)